MNCNKSKNQAEQNNNISFAVIGHIRNDFTEKFGIPRQSGLASKMQSVIVMEPEYRVPDAFRGIEEFTHLWIIWQFSMSLRDGWSPTVRPPRLGGNEHKGVFATRSPFRPNEIGLSCVKLEALRMDPELGPVLVVSGADLMSGTPILDIKPYLPYADAHPEAVGGFADAFVDYHLEVEFPQNLLDKVTEEKRAALMQVLEQDPRPTYQHDPNRIYGMQFGIWNIKFRVEDNRLYVTAVE